MNKKHYKYFQLKTQFVSEHVSPPSFPVGTIFQQNSRITDLQSKNALSPASLKYFDHKGENNTLKIA
jgi:hypothetical protein